MKQPTPQDGFKSGCPRCLGIAVALWVVGAVVAGLALSSQAAIAKDCRQETPLPADVRLIPPGPDVQEAVARFAGVWVGTLRSSGISRVPMGTNIIRNSAFRSERRWLG